MKEFRFRLAAGDMPLVTDTIGTFSSGNGWQSSPQFTPTDLTGATVKFTAQGPGVVLSDVAVIIDAPNGKVSYRFNATETAVDGDYLGEWQVTDSQGNVVTYPPKPFEFQIIPALGAVPEVAFAKLSDLFDDIRAVTGDFKKRIYSDQAIAQVMRVQLRLGRVRQRDAGPNCCGTEARYTVGPDNVTINPPIATTDIMAYSLLVYNSAKALVLPDSAAYSYRTRAMSERFGERKDFLFDLETTVYELENGRGIWMDTTGLRSWLFTINGIWIWSYLQIDQSVDLSYH